MTKNDFENTFAQLQLAYDKTHTPQEVESYFYHLQTFESCDFQEAVRRLPANEPRTAIHQFPKADTIWNYILDAKAGRVLRENKQEPRSVDEVLRRTLLRNITPEQQAWAKLCANMIRVGMATDEALRKRAEMITTFIDDYGPWLATRPDERDWLQTKL